MAATADWFVLINPASGGGRAGRRWPALERALRGRGIAFEREFTRAAGEGSHLAATAYVRGFRRMLAVGGDGTLNELLNGLLSAESRFAADCLVAAAPCGTGNDWARSLEVPDDAVELAECIARARARRVDLAIVEGGGRRTVCHTVAGAGLDAAVLARTPSRGPRALAYVVGLMRTIGRFRAPHFRLRTDGAAREGRYWLALVALGPRCGGGMRLAPRAAIDDGAIDFVTVDPLSLCGALSRLPRLFDGRLDGDPAFTVTRCRTAVIAADPPCDVEVDGQRFGCTPIAISLLPSGLAALDCRAGGG